jgi:type I restriction enzyme, S subunit
VSDLPDGWRWSTLGEIAKWGSGGTPARSVAENFGGDIPWALSGDINGGVLTSPSGAITELGLSSSSAKWVPTGAVLVAMYGATRGKVSVAGCDMTTNQAIAFAIPHTEVVDPKYLFYFLTSQTKMLSSQGKGAAQPNISQTILKAWPIPVPPLSEQLQIVEQIETLEDGLDAFERSLESIRPRLQHFLNSALRSELGNSAASAVRSSSMPSHWDWVPLRDLGEIRLGQQRAPHNHSGSNLRKYLKVANVFEDRIDVSTVMEMHFEPSTVSNYELKFGDILLNEGQSPQFLGRPAMYRDELPGVCFTNSLIRFRPHDELDREFALYLFRYYMRGGRFQMESKITTNIAHLSATRFSDICVPVPPLDEQREIVCRLDEVFEKVAGLEGAVRGARAQAELCLQSAMHLLFLNGLRGNSFD